MLKCTSPRKKVRRNLSPNVSLSYKGIKLPSLELTLSYYGQHIKVAIYCIPFLLHEVAMIVSISTVSRFFKRDGGVYK